MRRLELSQIQGFTLRGYPLKTVRYFVLQVADAAAARAFLGYLVQGQNADSLQLTTADAWSDAGAKPDYALNVGITWPGLVELGAKTWPDLSFESFPSFIAGSKAQADVVGDTGDSDPAHWVGGLGGGNDHVLLSLYASDNDALEKHSQTLRQQFTATGRSPGTGRRRTGPYSARRRGHDRQAPAGD
jgi:hypothetical protein